MFTKHVRWLVLAGVCGVAAAADLAREIILTPHHGEEREDREIVRWQEKAGRGDATAEAFEQLGWAYVAKARRTLDAGFYTLAEKTVDVLEAQFGARPESRLVRGHVWHNLHRFHAAERVARQLVTERGAPADWALLGDVLIEQGRLSEGIAALQRLMELKPGVEAHSRVAHVRWLKGDLAGAITAMENALAISDGRDAETRAWLLVRLAGFVLQRGDAARALTLATRAIERAPDYPPAFLVQGRALLALGRSGEAIEVLQRAEKLQPLPDYQWWLADALVAAGRSSEASAVEQRLKARGAENDPRTLALFLATRADAVSQALRLARAELKERSDVLSRDALAWSLAANGDLDAAASEMRAALAEGTRDARLSWHAGEIALARGERDAAAAHFAEAAKASSTLTPSERARLAERTTTSASLARH